MMVDNNSCGSHLTDLHWDKGGHGPLTNFFCNFFIHILFTFLDFNKIIYNIFSYSLKLFVS